jgi:uncharacterized protein YggU (UPF0235/DUF167 family)
MTGFAQGKSCFNSVILLGSSMVVYLKVKVKAGARRTAFSVKSADTFLINVKEPAENGRANQAVLKRLAEHLAVPATQLWIIKGAHSPSKIIAVR